MRRAIRITPSDHVAVLTEAAAAGEEILADGAVYIAASDIGLGHKVALRPIQTGADIIKYGFPIGTATADIAPGAHVHTHNLRTRLTGEQEYAYRPVLPRPMAREPGVFQGYRRADGRVGIRNELWVIPTVGCVNGVAGRIVELARERFAKGGLNGGYGGLDGVHAFPHPYGCSQLGEDHENTKKALCGLINHPNAGAALVLGLGCENNHVAGLQEALGHGDTERVKFLVCQDAGDETAAALRLLAELIPYAARHKREPVPMSELTVGLKCGGSDGFSGITANPAAGSFSDRLIAEGGAALLTEVPEMFGAETLLLARCANRPVFDKAVRMINGFKRYFTDHRQPVYENPSPGNKAGGITTLEEKSLGCTQKAGSAAVSDVLDYGESVRVKGLSLLYAPGNDLVATTALAVSGAHLVLFTTGRGTPFGGPVPTVKISTNTALYNNKRKWIDFNAGEIVNGEPIADAGDRLYEAVRRVASGEEQTRACLNGYREVALFKNGVTL